MDCTNGIALTLLYLHESGPGVCNRISDNNALASKKMSLGAVQISYHAPEGGGDQPWV